MNHRDTLRALIAEHADKMRDIPHPTRRHAKAGRTMLGYANHIAGRDLSSDSYRVAVVVVRSALGLSPGSGPQRQGPRACPHVVRLDARLRDPVATRAEQEDSTSSAIVDDILATSEPTSAPEAADVRCGREQWAVKVSTWSRGRHRSARDMSWVVAQALGVSLS